MRNALVVGGTGPTGPHVLHGLLERGYDVTIFHRGAHEPDDLPEVRHVHGDPHFEESITEAVGSGSYDVVVAAYGRTRLLADSFRGRAGHFLAIGGMPRYAGFYDPASLVPSGLPIPADEGGARARPTAAGGRALQFSALLAETEDAVLEAHPAGTCLVYPVVYGPRNVVPWEWSVIKRALDGRRELLLPDDGLAIHSRGAPENLAEFVLRAVDRPTVAGGQVYNCADDLQYSLRQWVEMILDVLGVDMTIVGVPSVVAPAFTAIYLPSRDTLSPHALLDTTKARRDLGYRDVVAPAEILRQSVDWYREHPVTVGTTVSAFADPFDYQLEDRLMGVWRQAVEALLAAAPQTPAEEVHPMPHPKRPHQLVDERGR